MKHWTILLIGFFTLLGIGLTASTAPAHEHRLSVRVPSGVGKYDRAREQAKPRDTPSENQG